MAGGLTCSRATRQLRFGAEIVNITAMRHSARAGLIRLRRRGVPAQHTPIVRDGTFVGYLPLANPPAHSTSSPPAPPAYGWQRIPLVRMSTSRSSRATPRSTSSSATRRRGPLRHEPLALDRRDAARLSIRQRDRLGDQERQARPDAQELPLQRPNAQTLGRLRRNRRRASWRVYGIPSCNKGDLCRWPTSATARLAGTSATSRSACDDAGEAGGARDLGGPAHVELLDVRLELLRFGRSRITYQHSEERVTLREQGLPETGRAVWGTLGSARADSGGSDCAGLFERLARAMPPRDVESHSPRPHTRCSPPRGVRLDRAGRRRRPRGSLRRRPASRRPRVRSLAAR